MPAGGSLRNRDRKLTEFFTQTPSASVPALAASSCPAGTVPATMSTTRKRSAMRISRAVLDRELSTSSSALPQVHNTSTMTTRKRPRSPDNDNPSASPFPLLKSKSPRKSVKTRQCDSDVGRPKTIIYFTSPFSSRNSSPHRQTPARMQNAYLATSPLASTRQVVYSSQSDEAELVLPVPQPPDLGKVAESVRVWRQKTSEPSNSSSASFAWEDTMEVDPFSTPPVCSLPLVYAPGVSLQFDAPICSTITSRNATTFQTPTVTSTCLPSPPDTDELPPLPSTPEPIDSEAKTAKLVAEIKARAFATNQSSDNEQPLSYRELEDSDDGDLVDDLPFVGSGRGKSSLFSTARKASDAFSSPLSSVLSTLNGVTSGLRTPGAPDHGSPPLQPTRASARTRKPAPASHPPLTISKSSTSVGMTKLASLTSSRNKLQATNPLYALLREKELENTHRAGCATLPLAEEAIKQGSCETSVSSDDRFGTMKGLCLADEQAAWKAVHEFRKSTSSVGPNGVEDFTRNHESRMMLGVVAGEAVNKIFASDKDVKGKKAVGNIDGETALDVSLWLQPSDEGMEVDPLSIPPLSSHPIFTCLDVPKSGDDSLLDLILRTGALVAVPRDVVLSNISQLLHIALFASSQIADAVSIALRDLWGLNSPKVQVPLAAILFALVQLGASPCVFEGLGLMTGGAQKNRIAQETLLEGLKRLLAIMKTAGFAGAFSSDDVANVVLILAIMGLDALVSSKLQIQLNITVEAVCNHSATDCILHDIHEKVLSFATRLALVNKARLVTLFASGGGRMRHIARRLAYCLLVPTSTISNNNIQDRIPPLEPLILLLSPEAGSCRPFDVTNGSTNYEELGHYINILSVALIDIAPYVEEERAIMKFASGTSAQGSPNKLKKPATPPLELLRRVLEVLQSKIVDTRAAHLDRSRTKAAIQRLTMRIYYDRMALIGVHPRPRAATLEAYFSPQRQ